MRQFDPFAHASERTAEDHERLGLEGITVVVEPMRLRGPGWSHQASFRDRLAALVEHEPARLDRFGLRHLQALGLPPGSVDDIRLAMACVEEIRPWLERRSVVAIGAIGPGTGGGTDEEAFKRQLDLAAEAGLPVIVTLPVEDAVEGGARARDIVTGMALDPAGVLVVSHDATALDEAREQGFWIGLPVGPGARMDRDEALDFMTYRGTERILIGSFADGDASDPLAVPGLVREAGRRSMMSDLIETVVWRNPFAFFGRSGRLDEKTQEDPE